MMNSIPENVEDGHLQCTRIVAVRHGETAWNVDTRIQGQLDIGLNDRGRWQAEQLASTLVDEGLTAIYSSDLRRASDTAAEIARACQRPLMLETGLRERCFGEFEGRTWAEIESAWPAKSERWRTRDLNFAPRGGESLPVFNDRVLACCRRLALAHPGECIAWVAHGGVMDCLYRAAAHVGLSAPRSWSLTNAAVNRLLFTGEEYVLVGWGDASHLDSPVLSEPVEVTLLHRVQAAQSIDGVGHAV
jgi:probable phosphoglycerate mutase